MLTADTKQQQQFATLMSRVLCATICATPGARLIGDSAAHPSG
jgi:hypothetical protein